MCKRIQSGIFYSVIILLTACSSADKAGSGMENIFRKEIITPSTADKVYLNEIINRTDNAGLPDEIMTRLKTRINFGGRLIVVNDAAQSDIEMNLEIFLLTIQPLKFDTTGNPVQKKMRALVSVSVINAKNKNVILKGKEVEGILLFSDITPPVMDMYSATAALADILSERIISVLMTGWYKKGVIPSKTE